MKQVKIIASNADVTITSNNFGHVVQLMNFMGHTQFNRMKEEYVNFCFNNSLNFMFHVGDKSPFCIQFEEVEIKEE